jgi:hypothetical protein
MIVNVPEDRWGTVYDANGVELEFCVWADTETGEAVHLIVEKSARGAMFTYTVNDAGEEILLTRWQQHPAPLRYVPHEPVSIQAEIE